MYENLKKLRESLGMTQLEFGKSVGVAKTTYNNYETGIREPKSDFWISVAEKYGVTIDYLMGYSQNPHLTFEEDNKKIPMPAHEVDLRKERIIKIYNELNETGKTALEDYSKYQLTINKADVVDLQLASRGLSVETKKVPKSAADEADTLRDELIKKAEKENEDL